MNPKTSMPGKGPVLEVRNLTKTFQMPSPFFERLLGHPRRVLTAVSDVSFTIDPGQTFSLVGESGCGKSLTCKELLRINDPKCHSTGRILFDDGEREQDILGRSFGVFGYSKTDLREIAIRNRLREDGVEKAKKQALKKLREWCLDSMAWKLRRARHMVDRAISLVPMH